MKKHLLLVFLFLTVPYLAWGATQTADSCSRDHVNTAIAAAANGDTVSIPAGACTWTSGITTTNAIKIEGATAVVSAGSECDDETETCITINLAGVNGPLGGADNAIFWFAPDDTAVAAVDDLETDTATIGVSGITFIGDNTSYKYAIQIYSHTTPTIRRARIHHNKFVNVKRAVGGPHGYVHGVFDNNTMYDTNMHYEEGASYGSFDNDRSLPGSGKGWYLEDNTIVGTGIKEFWLGGGNNEGGAVVYRYNTASGTQTGTCDYIDIHGNQIGINAGQFTEIYGNNIGLALANGSCNRLTYVRGGQIREFFNVFAGTGGGISIVEEYSDTYSNDGHPDDRCTTPHDGATTQVCSDSCICQKVHNSYFFNNRRTVDGTLINATLTTGTFHTGQLDDYYHLNDNVLNSPPEVAENREFFNYTASFDGTSGVGCGALTQAELNSTYPSCTDGVGYWSTSQDNCDDLDGWVGASGDRTSGLDTYLQGTLYRCTSGTWSAYYTPYEYPHPLRQEAAASYFDLTVTQPTNGTITNADNTVVCGTGGSVCSKSCLSSGSEVLTFTADSGYYMSAITGCSSSPCTLAMSEARAVSATFRKVKEATIGTGGTVTIGTGGTVTLQ